MPATAAGDQEKERPEEALEAVLERHRGERGSLIPLLQEAQGIYGYLPAEVLRRLARELGVPASRVFGVATFYAQFHLAPRGRHIVRVCQGTACHVRGSDTVLEGVEDTLGVRRGETTPDLRFTIEPVACLGCCGLAPVMMVDEEAHGRLTKDQVGKILAQYA